MNYGSATEIWGAVLGELQQLVTKTNYDTWLRGSVGLEQEGGMFIVGVRSPFAVEWLERRLYSLIKKTVIGLTGRDLDVRFQVYHEEGTKGPKTGSRYWPAARAANNRKTSLSTFNPKYTFESFIVGNCNRLAHAAALAVAEKPGGVYNPLFVYGGVGLGKTHLLHAIGHYAQAARLKTLYISTEQFTNEFIKAIRERKTEDFRKKYRRVDVLLVDDIHFIIGKEQTQEGFFHTFNDLHNANRQIVITSDRPPKSMPLLEDRLSSRFGWGLIADIQPPDLETRLAILLAKAEEKRVSVTQEVLDFIGRKSYRSIRELEGSLNRVVAFARLTRVPLTVEVASQALTDFAHAASRRTLTPAAIIDAVAKYFGTEPQTLEGKGRDKQTALARHVAIYLIREEIGCPYAEIGRCLGGRDHSATLRGYERISLQMMTSPQLRGDVLDIREMLNSKADS